MDFCCVATVNNLSISASLVYQKIHRISVGIPQTSHKSLI